MCTYEIIDGQRTIMLLSGGVRAAQTKTMLGVGVRPIKAEAPYRCVGHQPFHP